jgi:hypothetical protein
VVEKDGVVAPGPEPLDEATGLPIAAIVDASVKGQDADSLRWSH